jgi:hypothetical protein
MELIDGESSVGRGPLNSVISKDKLLGGQVLIETLS